MADKFTGLSKLLASVGIASVAATAPVEAAPIASLPAADDDDVAVGQTTVAAVVPEATALEAVATAKAAGVKEGIAAERARTATVLASEPARANLGGAAFLLAKTDASAEDIVSDLPQLGGVAPAPAAEAAPAAAPKLTVDLANTPKVEVGAGQAEASGEDTDKVWAEVQAERAASSPFATASIVTGGLPNSTGH